MARTGRPRADYLGVLHDVLVHQVTRGGPQRCPFRRAVRDVINDEYARKRGVTSKPLRARVYALAKTEDIVGHVGAIKINLRADAMNVQIQRALPRLPYVHQLTAPIFDAHALDQLRRRVSFIRAFADLDLGEMRVSDVDQLFTETRAVVARKIKQFKKRPKKSPD